MPVQLRGSSRRRGRRGCREHRHPRAEELVTRLALRRTSVVEPIDGRAKGRGAGGRQGEEEGGRAS